MISSHLKAAEKSSCRSSRCLAILLAASGLLFFLHPEERAEQKNQLSEWVLFYLSVSGRVKL